MSKFRRSLSKRSSNRIARKGNKVHKKNYPSLLFRGGYRL